MRSLIARITEGTGKAFNREETPQKGAKKKRRGNNYEGRREFVSRLSLREPRLISDR
jgi:hypothetical protein